MSTSITTLALSGIAAATGAYTCQVETPRNEVIIRFVDHKSTGVGGTVFPVPNRAFATGASYSASPVEKLVSNSTEYLRNIGKAMLPIDRELDEHVSSLMSEAYSKMPVKRLTRRV
ncbi:hypothetical protein [Microbulbifer sp. MCCC 1A16149]|uniref:hypothetical protein n=1 Tax=Microbulbifer sp. MCCC 1A16149 TaxID=3411322 RepID=UPI003D141AFA